MGRSSLETVISITPFRRLLPRCFARLVRLALAACIVASGLPGLAAVSASKAFKVPAGPAGRAVEMFAEQSGVEVLIGSDLGREVKTNAVQGSMIPREALDRMFWGTGVEIVEDRKTGALAIKRNRVAPKSPGAAPQKTAGDRSHESQKKKMTQTPQTQESMKNKKLLPRLAAMFALLVAPAAHAAEGLGTISGRVFNPTTSEYVRNAEVRIQGTNRLVPTESDGSFEFRDVPEGQTTVVVTHAGYQPATDTFHVSAGQTALREINISSTLSGIRTADGTVQMQKFVVSSDLEGNAKAIMEQKRSMNIINSVASDAFGDITEGNAGEFLKNIPGIELDWVQSDIRGVRMRGMDTQYTGLTVDGVKLAGADGLTAFSNSENGGGGGSSVRAPGFEQVSLTNVESIEVSKTLSADMDADAPAGSINFKSKRAFERKGRQIGWEARLALNSEEFHFKKTWGPGEAKHYKAVPGGKLEYSDTYFGDRLGIIASINQAKTFAVGTQIDTLTNTTTTATDSRPVIYNQFHFRNAPRFQDRSTATLSADLKATPNLVLSLSGVVHHYTDDVKSNITRFLTSANNTTATGRSTVIGDDPLLSFEMTDAAAGTRASIPSAQFFRKNTVSVTIVPRIEYRKGNFLLEAKGSYSRAKNTYDAYHHRNIFALGGAELRNSNFRFERSGYDTFDWRITQISGPDWTDLSNYGGNPIIQDIDRLVVNTRSSAQIDARYDIRRRFLSFIKIGGKIAEDIYKQRQTFDLFNYIGPGAGPVGSWADFPAPMGYDAGTTGAKFFTASGVAINPPQVNYTKIGGALHNHPEWFSPVVPSVGNFFNWYVNANRYFIERVPAAYVMGKAQPFRRLQLQAGLRWEQTETNARERHPRPNAEVIAAGFKIGGNGRATTIEGIDYQYLSTPLVWRKGQYENFFPSVGAKYTIMEDLIAHVGFNKAISRPQINVLSGSWTVNELDQFVSVPNPGLLPEYSDNYSARLSYYLQPVGNLAIGVFQNDISNLRSSTRFTAEEFGYGDHPVYSDYTFSTSTNGVGTRRFRGMEIEYGQHLTFLPGILSGLNISASYVRNYADLRRPGLVPHRYNAAVGFKYQRLNLRFSGTRMDETEWTGDNLVYQPAKTTYDLSGGFQLTQRIGIFFAGRNITNEPERLYRWVDAPRTTTSYLWRYRQYGASWTFGMKGTF